MRHGKTAFQNWQLAGCPTIPQRHYPHVDYFEHLGRQSQARQDAEAAMEKFKHSMANEPRKGWMHKAAHAVGLGRFLQRRHA